MGDVRRARQRGRCGASDWLLGGMGGKGVWGEGYGAWQKGQPGSEVGVFGAVRATRADVWLCGDGGRRRWAGWLVCGVGAVSGCV